jgi:hypothetical protein
MRENCLKHALAILRHLVVPEPKDFPAVALKIGVTNIVARPFSVLRAVGFDDQLSANAEKVDNVRTDRNLPAKLESAEAAITKKAPEAQFAVGGRAAHRSGAGALVRRDASVSLHRSSIGGQTLVRRAFGAPPSPRGRRGAAPQFAPTFSRRKKVLATPCPSLLPLGEGGAQRRTRALGSRLRKRPALRSQLL